MYVQSVSVENENCPFCQRTQLHHLIQNAIITHTSQYYIICITRYIARLYSQIITHTLQEFQRKQRFASLFGEHFVLHIKYNGLLIR